MGESERTMPSRVAFAIVALCFALFSLGARCIENDSLRRSEIDGDWHIYGEIHNETNVQGVEIIVQGTLFDAQGNVLATGQAPICPYELSPGSFSGYDIGFNNSAGIPQPASYKINVLSGRALTSPLPALDATVSGLQAERDGDTVTITGTVRANRDYPGDYAGCAAFYDSAGKTVMHWTIFGFGALEEDVSQPLELPLDFTPAAATSVRFWLIGPGSEPLESNYAAVVSGLIPID
jgi:hypothetical protein